MLTATLISAFIFFLHHFIYIWDVLMFRKSMVLKGESDKKLFYITKCSKTSAKIVWVKIFKYLISRIVFNIFLYENLYITSRQKSWLQLKKRIFSYPHTIASELKKSARYKTKHFFLLVQTHSADKKRLLKDKPSQQLEI